MLAPLPALVRQTLAPRRPHTKDAADLIIERCAEDSNGNTSTECGLLRHQLREALAKLGDTDIPRDPSLTYTAATVAGASLELGWRYRYRCVEVVECWHGGEEIARFLGESRLAVLADHLTFEVL